MNKIVSLRQRADYTHKPNLKAGRHGWLRLTPAYSVKVVEEIISGYDQAARVYDPFSGTATTALSAAYHGHDATTTDINPFLIWLGKAKTAQYSPRAILSARKASTHALDLVARKKLKPVEAPPIHNIERWWNREAIAFLCLLRAAIEKTTAPESDERTLLLVAFCRTLIELSNAAFNHQSMSFKSDRQLPFDVGANLGKAFSANLDMVLVGATDNPKGAARVILGDARDGTTITQGPFDLVITSPPYANRMSYIRELRPYMLLARLSE